MEARRTRTYEQPQSGGKDGNGSSRYVSIEEIRKEWVNQGKRISKNKEGSDKGTFKEIEYQLNSVSVN